MKHRPSRVRELLLRELGAIISRELSFDAALVTVRDASLTLDFKHAHIHVGVIGDAGEKRAAVAKLQEHRALLQRELAKRLILKYTPQLHFHLDESAERGTRVMAILDELDLPPAAEAYGDETAAEETEDDPILGAETPADSTPPAGMEEEADVDDVDDRGEPAEGRPARGSRPRRRGGSRRP